MITWYLANVDNLGDGTWKISHGKYLGKQKPITIEPHRLQEGGPVTEKERTKLRALLGALQWPSTQTSPHLQSQVSLLCGEVTTATVQTLETANKLLRFAKSNHDIGLEYRNIGSKDDVTFIAYSDASFACRKDFASQGGFMVAMVNSKVTRGEEGHYCALDWRSWKLSRVARSTLCAEAQAASEAADSLLYVATFWKLIWQPGASLTDPATPLMKHPPHLVIDAKALYDLLIKEEIQAAMSSDKRTTIEVLVTQDKLRCTGARVSWVSSELQYADGPTKQAAAQLLADRLRSHITRLKTDVTFQASKKLQSARRMLRCFLSRSLGRR